MRIDAFEPAGFKPVIKRAARHPWRHDRKARLLTMLTGWGEKLDQLHIILETHLSVPNMSDSTGYVIVSQPHVSVFLAACPESGLTANGGPFP